MTEEDILFRVRLDALQNKLTQKVTEDDDQGLRRGHQGLLQQEQEALRAARAPRPEVVLTKTEAKANEAKQALEGGEKLQGRREGVLDRRGLQGPGRQAARRGQGPAGEGLDDGRLHRREGQGRRARSRPSSATTSSRSQGHEGLAAVPRAGQGDHQEPAALAEPAEGARHFIKDFREKYKDETQLRRRLRGRRVQERSEATSTDTGPARPAGAGCGAAAGAPQGSRAPQGAAAPGRRPQAPQHAADARRRRASRPRAAGLSAQTPERRRRPRSRASTRSRGACARECPWDREQDERSIVPHTVEEAYELADAAHSGDDAKLLDELGDVLFQVYFLSLLLEERGAGRPGRGGGPLPREADPPPPARVRRAAPADDRAADGGAQLGRDQARGRARRRDLRRRCRRPCPPARTREGAEARPRGRPGTSRRGGRRATTPSDRRAACSRRRRGASDAAASTPSSRLRARRRQDRVQGGRRNACERDRARCTRGRSSTAAATRRSRSTWRWSPGAAGRAAVPSGASTGEFEAVELRDGGDAWSGKGVHAGGRAT